MSIKHNFRPIYFASSIICLSSGLCIYILFRNLNILIFNWIPAFNNFDLLNIKLTNTYINSFLLYNLPDILWLLSGIFFLRFLWYYNLKWQSIYIIIFCIIAVIFEILQAIPAFPGTFDIFDLIFIGIFAFIEGLIYKLFIVRRIL